MFTLADLRVLANAASFSRGRAYFEEGAVGRVRHRAADALFSAVVSGSADYTVELTLAPDGPDFFCDCPYDYDGICKHCVALGLAVLEEFGPEAEVRKAAVKPAKRSGSSQKTVIPTAAKPAAGEAGAAPPVSAAALEAALREVGKPEKLKFLEVQLRQNPALAQAFLTHFYGPPLPPDPLDADATLPRLDDLRDELRRALGRLRFDYDHLADDNGNLPPVVTVYGQASRFLPALTGRIGAVLEPVLRPVAATIRAALEAGRLAEAVRRWHGAWLGITGVKRPAADAYYLFSGGQYARQVAETWLRLLPEAGVEKLLNRQEFAPQEAERCISVLIRPVLSAACPARSRSSGLPAALPQVPDADQVLLLATAFNPSLAPALRAALQPHESRLPVRLRLRLAAGCRDWAAWEPLAVQEAVHNPDVVLSLLQFYLDHDRRTALLRAADTYFAPHAQLVGPFVLANVAPAESRQLYVKALTLRAETSQEFADFEELAGLWTSKERATFVKQVLEMRKARFSPWFRARVLAAENRPADILPLALQLDWHPRPRTSYWSVALPNDLADLPELLRLAARHAPEATLDAVMERTEEYLDDKTRRSVELYDRIGGWLKVLHELPALTAQVTLFAAGLYAQHNKLAYLRRALRVFQVLPEPEAPPARPGPAAAARSGRKPHNPFGR